MQFPAGKNGLFFILLGLTPDSFTPQGRGSICVWKGKLTAWVDQYCAVAKYKHEIKLALDLHVNLPILKKSQYIVGNIDFPRVATVADWGKEKDS